MLDFIIPATACCFALAVWIATVYLHKGGKVEKAEKDLDQRVSALEHVVAEQVPEASFVKGRRMVLSR